MTNRWSVTASLAFLSIALLLAGCGSKQEGTIDGASASVDALYKKNCLSCHGGKLEGRVGPDTNLTKVGGKLSREQIAAQIANGGGTMPGFKQFLNESEISALADWLSTKK